MTEKVNPHILHSNITMTVGELKEVLNNYPANMPVLVTYEGIHSGIREENFRLSCDRGRDELIIDVEDVG